MKIIKIILLLVLFDTPISVSIAAKNPIDCTISVYNGSTILTSQACNSHTPVSLHNGTSAVFTFTSTDHTAEPYLLVYLDPGFNPNCYNPNIIPCPLKEPTYTCTTFPPIQSSFASLPCFLVPYMMYGNNLMALNQIEFIT